MARISRSFRPYLLGWLVIFTLAFASTDLQGQEIRLSGRVIDVDSLQPLPSVHIFRQSDSLGTISSENGYFSIILQPTDSLIFSAVNYERKAIAIPDSLRKGRPYLEVEMKLRTILLKEVVVNAYLNPAAVNQYLENLDRLKQGKNKSDPKQDQLDYKGRQGTQPKHTVGFGSSTSPSGGTAIEGALTGLANLFNKRAKQQKRIKQLLEAEKLTDAAKAYDDFIDSKFNVEVIQEATGLEGIALDRFVAYCQLSNTFVYQATEYELLVAILRKLDSFQDQY